jgi:phospholipase C
MLRRLLIVSLLLLMALAVIPAGGAAASGGGDRLSRVNHIVVIYQENHSFDNLYGRWEGVNGLRDAPRAHTTQVN